MSAPEPNAQQPTPAPPPEAGPPSPPKSIAQAPPPPPLLQPLPILSDTSCPHLEAALDQIVAQYETVVTWAARVSLRKPGDLAAEPPTKRRRVQHPSCVKCGFSISSPWLCLECSLSACWSGPTSHILAHLREAGHNFAVEARTGSLWCNACETIILSRFLDNTHVTSQRAVEEAATVFHVDGKKRREPYRGIAPGQPQPAGESVPCSFRKGLLNLGNTCYMNSVLQSLLANPLLKNNMLADRHNAKACGTTLCIPCEFDKLFAELYEQSTEAAIAPATMLQSLWHISREVNGYGQHDAHEAFIALINGMHLHWRGSLPNSNACQCVIHTLFDGQLQSEVRCCNCNRGGRTVDPVLDLSLSIDASISTLDGCLKRYTRVEKLDARTCPDCNTLAEATRQLSIRRLPSVLYIQLKRFEQRNSEKTVKIETPIRFPSVLDMQSYVTKHDGTIDDETHSLLNTGPHKMYEYDLAAVICHEGSLDTGHYIAFTRTNDEWYRYDDDKVTHATLRDALAYHSQAYMLCYLKRRVEYRPIDPRSSVQRAREADLEEQRRREKEREQREKLEIERQLLDIL